MRKRSSTLAKLSAYVAVLFAVAYAWPWALDVSPSLPDVPGLGAAESLVPAVIGGDASESESKGRGHSRTPTDVAVAAGREADQPSPGEPGSPGTGSTPRPGALKPVYPSGYVEGGKVAVAVPAAGGSLVTVLERQLATLSEGECRDFGPWTEVEPVNVIPDGTCARFRTVVGEDPAEQAVSVAENLVRRDDTSPTPPRLAISETSENAHAASDRLFYRAGEGEAGSFTLAAVAADPQSGVAQVAFPALGDTPSSSQPGPDARVSYAWSSSVSTGAPTEGVVVATNGAGAESEAPVQMVGDADPPAGGFVSYAGGLHRDGRVEVAVDPGEDAVSGVADGSEVLEEQDARLAGGRCKDGWGSWHAAVPGGSPGRPACVRFRYRVSDNVGNEVIYESSVVAKVVDQVRPTVALVAPGDGATVSGTVTVSAEADDLGFGVAAVRLQFSRTGRCHTEWRTIATVASAPYSAVWTTSSLAPGRYRVRAVAADRAGNSSASEPIVIQIATPVTPEPPGNDDEKAGDPPRAPDHEDEDEDDDSDTSSTASAPSTAAEESPPAVDELPATQVPVAADESAAGGAAPATGEESGSATAAGLALQWSGSDGTSATGTLRAPRAAIAT